MDRGNNRFIVAANYMIRLKIILCTRPVNTIRWIRCIDAFEWDDCFYIIVTTVLLSQWKMTCLLMNKWPHRCIANTIWNNSSNVMSLSDTPMLDGQAPKAKRPSRNAPKLRLPAATAYKWRIRGCPNFAESSTHRYSAQENYSILTRPPSPLLTLAHYSVA